MTNALAGRYFFPDSARFIGANAIVENDHLRVEDLSGGFLCEAELRHVQISSRLGNLPRRFALPDGARFETDDNDAADRLLKGAARIHSLERSWRWVGISVLFAGLAAFVFVIYGIPATARWLAAETPASVNSVMAKQALEVLDRAFLTKSELSAQDQRKAQTLFKRVATLGEGGTTSYRLLFRASDELGPNALALPDGTIIMTDELWSMVKADDEIEGVFAHEIAHVDRNHSLQRLYQAALVPAALSVVTGDVSQVTQLATVLPGILVQAAYSRDFEQQADDDAAIVLRRLGGNPAHMADFLERLEKNICSKRTCPPNWLGTHPETGERVLRLRNSTRTKPPSN